jgi:tetratricopeptide (TPR) repeat protein
MRLRPAAACIAIALSTVIVHAQSRASELADAGWKALRNENATRAATLFAEALELAPDDPGLLFGAGAAAHAKGRQQEAMAWLGRSLEIRPQLTAASVLLGRIAFDEGDTDLATRTYEQALKYSPDNAALKRQLDLWRREADAHQTFSDRRFARFRVLFEGREEQSLAMTATAVFDSAFYRIGSMLGEYPADTIVAVLYTEQQFRDITRAPSWSGGQYDGRIRIPVAGASAHAELFERVLIHELSHAVIAKIAPHAVPAWLDEGLAQHFEGADPESARRRMKAGGRSIPLPQLEGGFGRFGAFDARVAYDESLLAVGVLLDHPGFSWIRLLHRLRDGASFADAIGFSGYTYADLEAGWRK